MAKPATKSRTKAPPPAEVVRPARRRQVIFFLSPRLIDFDTYLPIAMALKAARPAWRIRFAVFSGANHQVILSNPTLVAGLERCGTLHKVGGSGSRNAIFRWPNRAIGFARVTAWIVSSPRPVLFHGRQFTSWPYAAWYLLARLFGGRGIILARARLPDDGIHPHRRSEYELPERPASMLERLFGRDNDGLVYYHDRQSLYLRSLAHYGRLDNMPTRRIGLPSRLPEWQRLIESKTAEERTRLARANKNLDEIYCFFSAKGYSSTHLREPDSAQATFRLIITTLRRLRPQALILLRPHPLALKEEWFKAAMDELGDDGMDLCFAHPDVMLRLSRRAIVNNPTNIMFTADHGRFIDCSDYRRNPADQAQPRSLAAGYGVWYVDPVSADFEAHLSEALDDAAWEDRPELTERRERLIANNKPNPSALLDQIERGRVA